MKQFNFNGFTVEIVGVGDVTDEGKPQGRGILFSIGAANGSGERHRFLAFADEDAITAAGALQGCILPASISFKAP